MLFYNKPQIQTFWDVAKNYLRCFLPVCLKGLVWVAILQRKKGRPPDPRRPPIEQPAVRPRLHSTNQLRFRLSSRLRFSQNSRSLKTPLVKFQQKIGGIERRIGYGGPDESGKRMNAPTGAKEVELMRGSPHLFMAVPPHDLAGPQPAHATIFPSRLAF